MDVPEDIREKAKAVLRDLSCGRIGPVSAIAQALLAERLAQKERDAKIADELFYLDETKISARIRDAIRKS